MNCGAGAALFVAWPKLPMGNDPIDANIRELSMPCQSEPMSLSRAGMSGVLQSGPPNPSRIYGLVPSARNGLYGDPLGGTESNAVGADTDASVSARSGAAT